MQFFLSADITGAYFCYPLQEGPQGGDLTCFLTHRGKYVFTVLPQGCSVSQDFLGTTLSEALDHEDLKDDNNKTVIRIIDDIAGCSKDLPDLAIRPSNPMDFHDIGSSPDIDVSDP